jgi:hypothetical protein
MDYRSQVKNYVAKFNNTGLIKSIATLNYAEILNIYYFIVDDNHTPILETSYDLHNYIIQTVAKNEPKYSPMQYELYNSVINSFITDEMILSNME